MFDATYVSSITAFITWSKWRGAMAHCRSSARMRRPHRRAEGRMVALVMDIADDSA